jgi:hypothetical protein
MPVMTLFRSPRINQMQYDAIIQALDLEDQPQTGILTHACGFDQNGICVQDIWESRLDLESFLANRLKPAFAKLDIAFVEPEIIETYKFRVSEGVDRYKLGQGPTFGAEREWPAAEGPTLEAGR